MVQIAIDNGCAGSRQSEDGPVQCRLPHWRLSSTSELFLLAGPLSQRTEGRAEIGNRRLGVLIGGEVASLRLRTKLGRVEPCCVGALLEGFDAIGDRADKNAGKPENARLGQRGDDVADFGNRAGKAQ
jgi:hypothetical protein